MASKDFIPDPDPEFDIYAAAFAGELGNSGTSYGFTSGEVTGYQGDAAGFHTALVDVAAKKAAWEASVQNKNTLRGAFEPKTRGFAKRIKDSTAYTPAVGEAYDIIAEEIVFVPATYKTTLKARVVGGVIEISWTKGQANSVRIYTRLAGQTTWTYLDRDEKSPYKDTRPLAVAGHAETREYMARGVLDDAEIGLDSDIISVVFSG